MNPDLEPGRLFDVISGSDREIASLVLSAIDHDLDGNPPSAGTHAVIDWQRRWRDLEFEIPPAQTVETVPVHTTVSRLSAWAAQLLPAGDRLEYAELFRSELYDLAQSGSGRWAQLAYAIRVLVRAPLLRRELRAPARERSR